ncbi:fatty acid desaturase [Penicillium malachiteum]|uniref:Fatty acid desaturase n=1 Tax=Penicillium malachiteum TaxID=1324776 RepID=A0AAD6HLP6_9EURO|nr:fatty acid desaturase [Penicillium malachiteum]
MTLTGLIQYQLAGWTGGEGSLPASQGHRTQTLSHFDPFSRIFTRKQGFVVLISDLGIVIMSIILFYLGSSIGFSNVFKLYLMPYLWVHHWLGEFLHLRNYWPLLFAYRLVAITFLHHTHPSVLYYTIGTWSFKKGALATVDRSFGPIGRHFFHDIIDHHVVHHLFSKFPFYKAKEATQKIEPLLGSRYISEKEEYFLFSLWSTFRQCQCVSEATGIAGAFQWKLGG